MKLTDNEHWTHLFGMTTFYIFWRHFFHFTQIVENEKILMSFENRNLKYLLSSHTNSSLQSSARMGMNLNELRASTSLLDTNI